METKIKKLYSYFGLIRRFRKVKDGLWIYPKDVLRGYGKFKGGIWINSFDFKENPKHYLKLENGGFLFEVDDELRKHIEKGREFNIDMEEELNHTQEIGSKNK